MNYKLHTLKKLFKNKKTVFFYMCVVFTLIMEPLPSYGDISTDGTLGPATDLTGPNFIVPSEIGLIKGENLFHSFRTFNLNTNDGISESATFTGPDTISNIISRVTGGYSSWIDGRLTSEISGADFYFINPSGVLFGPNAILDIGGSFHVSTADYLKLGESGRFDATLPDESIFVSAPPSAFGFTSANPAGITIGNVNGLADPNEAANTLLEVPEGETISIIGGKIQIVNSSIFAQSGRINMASVDSSGEVVPGENDLVMEGFENLDDIEILRSIYWELFDQHSTYGDIEASGMIDGHIGGNIYIRGANCNLISTIITSSNFDEESSGAIDVQLTGNFTAQYGGISNIAHHGEGKDIEIRADSIELNNGVIKNSTEGTGDGGNININASVINIMSKSGGIYTVSDGSEGRAGNIIISANHIFLDSSGSIFTTTITSENYNLTEGNAGNIDISTSTLDIKNKGSIQSSSINNGNAGKISITAEHINIESEEGGTIETEQDRTIESEQGGILTTTSSVIDPETGELITIPWGNAGEIEIKTSSLEINNNGTIQSSSTSHGNSGKVVITADNIIIDSGNILTNSYNIKSDQTDEITTTKGDAGEISISASVLKINNLGRIQSSSENEGDAGTVTINNAKNISLNDGSQITVSSQKGSTGDGGNIIINNAGDILITGTIIKKDEEGEDYPFPSQIVAKAFSTGSGGNITIEADNIELSDSGKINARSESEEPNAGKAGEINLTANDTIKLNGSAGIETYAENAGGGQIVIKSGSIQLIDKNQITSQVKTGENSGGDIHMTADSIVALNGIEINASAEDGKGGNIIMDTDVYLKTDDLILDASSRIEGNEGKIEINAPDIDISGELSTLSTDYMDASRYIKSQCATLSGDNVSQFIIQTREGLPLPIDDFQPSPVIREESLFFKPGISIPEDIKTPLKNAAKAYEKGEYANAVALLEPLYSNLLTKIKIKGRLLGQKNKSTLNPDTVIYPALFHTALVLSRSYQRLGFHETAKKRLTTLTPFLEKQSSFHHTINALFYSALGDLACIFGQSSEAHKYFMESIQQSDLSDDSDVKVSIMNNIANLFAVTGYASESMKIYARCLDLIQKQLADAQNNKQKAIKSLSSPLSPRTTDLAATIHLNTIELQMILRQEEFSHTQKRQWASIPMENPDALLAALKIRRTLNTSYILIPLNPEEIQLKLTTANKIIRQQQDGNLKILNLASLTRIALELDEIDIADDALTQSFTIASNMNNNHAKAYLCGYMGRRYEKANDPEAAMALTRKAIHYTSQQYAPEMLYKWYWQMGRLYKNRHQTKQATFFLLKAMEILTPIQREFFQGYHKKEGGFKENVKPVYLELAALYLELAQTSNNQREEQRLLIQARDVLEYLKAAEIQSFFQDECIAETQERIRIKDNEPGTAIIYPILLKDRLTLLASFEGTIKPFFIDVSSTIVHKTVMEFYNRLQQPDNNRFRFHAKRLHEWLIQPLASDLVQHDINTLVISPDGILGLIPFGALFDGRKYLVEKYAVAVIPGITLTDHEKASGAFRALACGLSYSANGFPALPYVSKELKAVDAILGDKILENELFTTRSFMEALSSNQFNILHIATHGNFGITPDQTFLLTHNGRFTMDELRQLVLHLKFREQPIELITLSACQTATGDERSALGLAGTALGTGVKSALATLWTVDDAAAFTLVKGFYETLTGFNGKNIEHEVTKSRALQLAQREMIEMENFRHPFFWAPFILVGNWL
ncbi:exported hypothetical protein [Desulfamplus magnetovallimortis]|uniref:Filamentous haemagglutinin FhaB/tRNA nuclease CdiA-like TPS domain-containing protein n=1 Tax=Desulfamplus magnetovallimortis TaxID=1246637 RepID=A0A1W1HDU7_9BACT|nr:CHAT domain-containing protein [Desulfamplus magnetovallimortis]SLM30671.1 exported hypothetical protein [Desulfamplus magnetovallimortis]